MKRTRDWGSGVGTSMKNRCPCETDKCDKSHGKNRESLHIYSEYWMQGGGGRCPYLNRKSLKKRNKRNVFYMMEKYGRIY